MGSEYYKFERRPASFSSLPRTPDEPRALTREPKLLIKLTAAPTRSARLEGYIEYDNSKSTNTNAGPLVLPEALAFFERPARMANARLTWPLNDRTLVEARYGDFWRHATSGPTDPSRMSGPPGHFDSFTRVRSVNVGQFSDGETQTSSTSATLTRNMDTFLGGSHTFKTGVEHEWATLTSISGWPGGAQYSDYNGAPDFLYLWDGATYRASQRRTAMFAQDRWRVNDRLTVEPGVRVAVYDGSVPVEAIASYRNSSVSPRLGAAWDVAPDHRTVIQAHYGRYHDPLVTSFYDFLDPLSQTSQIVLQVDGTGQFQELTRFLPATRYTIDPEAKHSYADEYFVGVEREVRTHLSVRAQYVHRDFKESLGFIDTGSTWTPVGVIDPGVDGRLGTTDDGGPMTVYYNNNATAPSLVLTNPEGAFRHYNALQAIATARDLNGMYLQASYSWARTRGSFNNEFSSNAANNDLSVNGDFVNPNRALYSIGAYHARLHARCQGARHVHVAALGWGSLERGVSLHERQAVGQGHQFRSADAAWCYPCRTDWLARVPGDQQCRRTGREDVQGASRVHRWRVRQRVQHYEPRHAHQRQLGFGTKLRPADCLGRSPPRARRCEGQLLARSLIAVARRASARSTAIRAAFADGLPRELATSW